MIFVISLICACTFTIFSPSGNHLQKKRISTSCSYRRLCKVCIWFQLSQLSCALHSFFSSISHEKISDAKVLSEKEQNKSTGIPKCFLNDQQFCVIDGAVDFFVLCSLNFGVKRRASRVGDITCPKRLENDQKLFCQECESFW